MTSPRTQPPAERSHPAVAALLATIERIEGALADEQRALRSLGVDQLKEIGERKARGLVELSRTIRALDGVPRSPALRARLDHLRGRLEENRAALALHLAAAKDVSALVAQAIEEAESDGTYSRSIATPAGR